MKKILTIMMALIIVIGCIVPVSASEIVALDENVYNLVTSFIGDASTSRGFAWTAVDGYENMVLRLWVSDENDYAEIEPSKIVDKGTHIYYKADALNLTADTKYTYKIGDTVKNEWYGPFVFETKAEEVNNFSFIAVSDPQGSAEGDYNYFNSDIAAAVSECPDAAFIVNLGDLVNNGYNENQWKWHFDAIKDYCTEIPYMGVVGNHDVLNPATVSDTKYDVMWDAGENFSLHLNHPDNGADAMKKISSDDMKNQWFQDIARNLEDTFYSFDYGDAHFVVLNTTAETSITGTYGEDLKQVLEIQRDWLAEDLANTDAKWKIVLMHMGAYRADSWRKDIGSKEYFGSIIDSNGVDLVLEGHDHIYMRTYPIMGDNMWKTSVDLENFDSAFTGTTYSVMGVAANKRYNESQLKGPGEHVYIYKNTLADQPTYCVFDVNSERICVTAKQQDGTILDEYSITKSDTDDSAEVELETTHNMTTVKGMTQSNAIITALVTPPDVETVTSLDDIIYVEQLTTNQNGSYCFNFSNNNPAVGEYKVKINIQGTSDEYGYMYKPQLYLYDGNKRIDKLSDVTGNSLVAELKVINPDNGILYCAQFKDGILVDVSNAEIEAGPTGGVTFSYRGTSNVDEIKMFFWDKTSNKPFMDKVIIK